MNKNDLIEAVAERTGLAKSDAARAVEAVLGAITEALQKGDTVALSGVGSFAAKARAARTGRNPRTGESFCTHVPSILLLIAASSIGASPTADRLLAKIRAITSNGSAGIVNVSRTSRTL